MLKFRKTMVLCTKLRNLHSVTKMKLLLVLLLLLILNMLLWSSMTAVNQQGFRSVMEEFLGEEVLSPRDREVFASLWNRKLAWSFNLSASSTNSRVVSLHAPSGNAYLDAYENAAEVCRRIYSRYAFRQISPAGSNSSCTSAVSLAIPAVSCEMFRSFATFSTERLQQECQPQNYTNLCHFLNQSALPCTSPLVVQGFDYHKQHHCLSSIVDQLTIESSSNSLHNKKTEGKSQSESSVPKILHYIWYYDSKKKFDFTFYLGLISTMHYWQPSIIFLWHDGVLPSGHWWSEFLKQLHPPAGVTSITVNVDIGGKHFERLVEYFGGTTLYYVYRRKPADIYGNKITNDAHKSDIVRLEALINYGGLYIDTDVLTLRNIDLFVQYPVTMPKEPTKSISNSIIFAQRFAPYLVLWHHTYTTFESTEWGEHSTTGNYQLSLFCPSYVHQESDVLMKPSSTKELYVLNISLASKYMFHLYWNWEKLYAPKGSFREAHEPEEIMDWRCTMGRIMRSIFLGTCSKFCG